MQRVATSTGKRGCGNRKAGGSYICTGSSPDGAPIEEFLIDPVSKLDLEAFRAPIVFDDPANAGLKHILVWVGAEFYASPVDYIEETRHKGASRRIPTGFDLNQLTPGKSRMILVHPKAFTPHVDVPSMCPTGVHDIEDLQEPCIGAQYHYVQGLGSQIVNDQGSHDREIRVMIGDITYEVPEQMQTEIKLFSPGAFMQLPITHIEYQARDNQDTGPESLEQYEEQGWEVNIIDDPAIFTQGGQS